MGARAAIIVGKQFEQTQTVDIRLLHKPLIRSVLRGEESAEVGAIHEALRKKVLGFDVNRLGQLGYDLRGERLQGGKESMENDGFTIRSGFSNAYWNLVQTLSCVKAYSSKVYCCVCLNDEEGSCCLLARLTFIP